MDISGNTVLILINDDGLVRMLARRRIRLYQGIDESIRGGTEQAISDHERQVITFFLN
jgi:hypothetical protein